MAEPRPGVTVCEECKQPIGPGEARVWENKLVHSGCRPAEVIAAAEASVGTRQG